ncbi:MAG: VCBS repeat-containing protein [Myxococcota bacterium]
MAVAVAGPREVARVLGLGSLLLAGGCITVVVTPESDDDEDTDAGATSGSAETVSEVGSEGTESGSMGSGESTSTGAPATTGSTTSGTSSSETGGFTTSGSSTDGSSSTGPASESSGTDEGASDSDGGIASGSSTGTGGGPASCGDGVVEPPGLCFTRIPMVFEGPGQRPAGLVYADFDDDGVGDYVEGSLRTFNNSIIADIGVHTGDATVGLIDAATHPILAPGARGGVQPGSMHGEDFDGDGRTDLAFIEMRDDFLGFHPHLQIWTSLGNTDFNETFTHPFTPFTDVHAVTGEFTGDGLPDVLTYDSIGMQVWPGIGGGQLGMPLPSPMPSDPSDVLARAFDGDALTDLWLEAGGSAGLWLGQPGGTFVEVAAPDCSGQMSARDLDGDDVVDLVCNDGGVLDLHFGLGDATFEPPVTVTSPATLPERTGFGDVDGDGILDLLWTLPTGATIAAYTARGLGAGVFGPTELLYDGLGISDPIPTAIWARDVNGDGVDDVFVADSGATDMFVVDMLLSDP